MSLSFCVCVFFFFNGFYLDASQKMSLLSVFARTAGQIGLCAVKENRLALVLYINNDLLLEASEIQK